MILSKENTDISNKVETLHHTTAARKRRLRRQKLKAARVGNLDTNGNAKQSSGVLDIESQTTTQLDSITITNIPENPGTQLSNEKQKFKSDDQIVHKAQISESKEDTLINNQNTETKSQILVNNNISTLEGTTGILKKGFKSENFQIINNFSESFERKSLKFQTLPNIKPNKNLKFTPANLEKDNKSQDLCNIETKKDRSDDSNLAENKTDQTDLKGIEKSESKPQNRITNERNEINSHNYISIHDQISEESVVIKNNKNLPSHSKSLSPEHSEFDYKLKSQKENCGEKQVSHSEMDNKKSVNHDESQKQQHHKNEETSWIDPAAKSRDEVKAAREAKKLAKQKAKNKTVLVDDHMDVKTPIEEDKKVKGQNTEELEVLTDNTEESKTLQAVSDLISKNKIKEITTEKVIKKSEEISKDKMDSINEKGEQTVKSKAELKAERRAKQEAQRAAKEAAVQKMSQTESKGKELVKNKEEKTFKPKSADKSKAKTQSVQRVDWFQQLKLEKDKNSLKNIAINSNLHPAVVKLGVQLASHVVSGSNARCIALLDALKKMVRDYSLPARTEFARGLQAQLTTSEAFLWALRPPAASETNALKHFRRQITQLPANVDEFDAKKKLQEEIDRYIREQIDMAGEAISLIVRAKISPGDHVLTYGCSSLIERILCEAWAEGARFRATVVGTRVHGGAREMLRRLCARGLPAAYVDLSALSYVMSDVQKVILGAGSLLANGAVLGAIGSAQVALVARERNVPVLVACETHKFSERLHIDPLVYSEIGDPDELIDKTDENSALKDWRSNPNLTLLNLTYDVTPPSLVSAVVTELGILPCTSAPVVLRFKLSEYGI